MTRPHSRGSALHPAILGALLAASVSVPALAAGAIGPVPPTDVPQERILVAQNNQGSAQLLVRLQELEQVNRELTGRIEGLEFQVKQLLEQLAKQAEDNEFRFQQLEGGAVGKPQAAAPTDGVTPSDTLPQTPAPQDDAAAPAPAPDAPALDAPALDAPAMDAPAMDGMPADAEPLDDIGDSADPLLRGGIDQLGTMPEGGAFDLDSGRPLDLSLNSGGPLSEGDAEAQFKAGFNAVSRGEYDFAADQLAQFLQYFPEDPRAPDALNNLGEALIQQAKYEEAARALAEGFPKYRESPRAPEILRRLSIALLRDADQKAKETGPDDDLVIREREAACGALAQALTEYPDLMPASRKLILEEQQKAQCPVTN